MYSSYDENLYDPSLKNEEWARKKVYRLRNDAVPLVDPFTYQQAMRLILSDQDMQETKDKFEDPDAIDKEMPQISLMEKLRNILKAERNKAGIKVSLDAVDPSAKREKDEDRTLLKNRASIEQVVTNLQQSIGGPQYKLANEKDENGKGPFNGNAGEGFDKLGLKDTDSLDIDYFFDTHYQLEHVIAGNQVLNHIVKVNNVKSYIDYWCNDIMAVKCIAARMFVDEISGQPSVKYLNPSQVRIVPGKMKDGSDAKAISYVEKGSIGDFLKLIGKQLDWRAELPYLLSSINAAHNTRYTSVFDGQGNDSPVDCSYSKFIAYSVTWEQIYWKEWDALSFKSGNDRYGRERMIPIKVSDKVGERSSYNRDDYYNETVYGSIYLPVGGGEQKLYKFGKLFHQAINGSEDELANFPILIRKEEGPSVAKIAKPYVKFANTIFYMFKKLTLEAKRKGTSFDFDSQYRIAQKMLGAGFNTVTFKEFLEDTRKSPDGFHLAPQDSNGKSVGGGGNPNFPLENGLDPMAIIFQQIVDWCQGKIMDYLGINEFRDGSTPDPKTGLKVGLQALAASRNATDYMSEMILSVIEQCGYMSLWISQDVVRYKSSVAYTYLKKALGEDTVIKLQELKGFAFHRYNIFINTFNNDIELAELKQMAQQAFLNKDIDYPTYQMISDIDDPKKGGYELAYAKAREDKKKQQEAEQLQQSAMALDQQKTQNQLLIINTKGQWDVKVEETRGSYYLQGFQATANADVQKEILRQQGEPNKQDAKAAGQIKIAQEKAAIEQQKV